MDRVQRYVRIAILIVDINYNEIVNVIKVVAETLSSDVWVDIANDKVTSRADTDLVGDVAWKYELAVVPGDLDLHLISMCRLIMLTNPAYAFAMDVDVIALGVIDKVLSSSSLKKGHARSTVMRTKVNV